MYSRPSPAFIVFLLAAAFAVFTACGDNGGGEGTVDSGVHVTDGSLFDALPSADAGPDALAEPGIRVVGRTDLTNPDEPRFEWSGAAVLARFRGSSISLMLYEEWGTNLYEVFIDDERQQVLETSPGSRTYPLASGLAQGEHEVLIHRRTEAFFGPTRLLGLDLGDGELLAPPAPLGRRMEVIGDSITAGYGNEGPDESCPFTAQTENHYLTYAAIAARQLGAELHTIAWSGIGIYRNNDGSTDETMVDLYERAIPTDQGSGWDFARWIPHVVLINLGTNDFAGGAPPQQDFVEAYLAFLERIRQAYPQAQLICGLGPMLSGGSLATARSYIQEIVSEAGGTDEQVRMLEFEEQDPADNLGCDWHPGLVTHEKMAQTLTTEVRAIMGW